MLALNNDPWGHKVMAAPKGQILHNPNSCVSLWGWRCPDDRGFLQTVKQFGPVCAGEGKIQRPMLCPVMCESKIGRVSVDCLNDGLTMKCLSWCDLSGFQPLQSFNWRLAACLVTHTGRLKLLFPCVRCAHGRLGQIW